MKRWKNVNWLKSRYYKNTDEVAEEVAEELTAAIHCDVVQIIGRVLVLFKPSSKEKYQKISAAVKRDLILEGWTMGEKRQARQGADVLLQEEPLRFQTRKQVGLLGGNLIPFI